VAAERAARIEKANLPVMKSLSLPGKAVLAAALCSFSALLWSGCATQSGAAYDPPRFHDAHAANVVLRFSSWDYTFLVRPEFREDGYYHQLTRNDIVPTLRRLEVPRDMAVVTVGWGWSPDQLNRVVADWKTLLTQSGFRRVVIVRSTSDNKLDGAILVDDSRAANSTSLHTASL
jgi:hypothetical protein